MPPYQGYEGNYYTIDKRFAVRFSCKPHILINMIIYTILNLESWYRIELNYYKSTLDANRFKHSVILYLSKTRCGLRLHAFLLVCNDWTLLCEAASCGYWPGLMWVWYRDICVCTDVSSTNPHVRLAGRHTHHIRYDIVISCLSYNSMRLLNIIYKL